MRQAILIKSSEKASKNVRQQYGAECIRIINGIGGINLQIAGLGFSIFEAVEQKCVTVRQTEKASKNVRQQR